MPPTSSIDVIVTRALANLIYNVLDVVCRIALLYRLVYCAHTSSNADQAVTHSAIPQPHVRALSLTRRPLCLAPTGRQADRPTS